MHNKSFTVDNVVTVVGGRNIADEYYEIGEDGLVDLDVIAVGDAVKQVSTEFDLYWNSASAYPAKMIIGRRAARAARRAGAARAGDSRRPDDGQVRRGDGATAGWSRACWPARCAPNGPPPRSCTTTRPRR